LVDVQLSKEGQSWLVRHHWSPKSIGFSGAQLSKSIESSSVPGDGLGFLQLTSRLVLVPLMQHTWLEGQSVGSSQVIGTSGTKFGGAGHSVPRTQNTRVVPEAVNSEQHSESLRLQRSLPHCTCGCWQTPALAHCPVAQRVSVAGARQMPPAQPAVHVPLQAELQQMPPTQLP
jgi:hypothetical protein